jgi:glycosyltransferase involved in cell wall biosynthesis
MQRSHKVANWIIRHLVDAEICITHDARNAVVALGWAKPSSTFVVHNGIEVDRFSLVPDKAIARRELGLPQDVLLIGMVARLVWWKGGLDLLKVLLRLPARWHAMFAGEGPFDETLRRFVSENGLTARTHFLGALADVRPAYGAMDAYAFLSRHEPFGLVLGEAMAAGVPVFGLLGEGGFSEPQYPLLTPENALLIPRAQPLDWCAEEDPLVLDRLAKELGLFGAGPKTAAIRVATAKEWVRTRFDAEITARNVTEIYEKLLLQRHFD